MKTDKGKGFLQLSTTPFWETTMGQDIIKTFPILGPGKNREAIGKMAEDTFWDGLLDHWNPFKIPVFLPEGWDGPVPEGPGVSFPK